MRYEDFVADVAARGAFEDAGEAERAALAVARVLGERLLAEERTLLVAALPEPVASHLSEAPYERDFDLAELYDRVARSMAVHHAFGIEHAQVVCQVIADLLPEGARLHLPSEIRPLFSPRQRSEIPERPVRARPEVDPGEGTTLATGRPGSRHPLSEAHPDPAHRASVARLDDPHGETKLSSARGTTQERLGDTLAEGKPGPASPVSDTRR